MSWTKTQIVDLMALAVPDDKMILVWKNLRIFSKFRIKSDFFPVKSASCFKERTDGRDSGNEEADLGTE